MVDPATYLKRAFGLLSEVDTKLNQLRQNVISHDQSLNQIESLGGWFATMQGGRQIRQEKGRLLSDLQLAWSEVDKCAASNPTASLETEIGRVVTVDTIRAGILFARGQVEMTSGASADAKRLFSESLQHTELPDSHFMLGLLYEGEYNPAQALKHFERCLELAPDGDLAVAALREANDMRNYKKGFRGSWGTFFLLLLFCFPVAPVYFFRKYK